MKSFNKDHHSKPYKKCSNYNVFMLSLRISIHTTIKNVGYRALAFIPFIISRDNSRIHINLLYCYDSFVSMKILSCIYILEQYQRNREMNIIYIETILENVYFQILFFLTRRTSLKKLQHFCFF